ncbi:hypothetical protein O9G_001188 [Rozella allomycis CSF55]|uniref:Uncharacterized protein n=1 Tax=Rozella allomycis (strain CSF55) TaxID=988480 RepID=A0A075AXF7_ROZAC|nr:hypothetical protein O9G_001188 [Rozella allomycis CSF55]|eukprot:EPZ33219.1 hypothetical protein O9G_001188 [Rozella allomycis CSF55]
MKGLVVWVILEKREFKGCTASADFSGSNLDKIDIKSSFGKSVSLVLFAIGLDETIRINARKLTISVVIKSLKREKKLFEN